MFHRSNELSLTKMSPCEVASKQASSAFSPGAARHLFLPLPHFKLIFLQHPAT